MALGTIHFYDSTRGGDNVQSIVSDSFTPDANCLLVIAANHTIKVGSDNTANVTISNTGGLTFTKLEHHSWAPISYGANLNIWYCEVGSSPPSSMTVTVEQATADPSYGSSIDIFSWTGYPVGAAFGLVEKFNRGTGYPNFTTGDGPWNLTLTTAPASTSEVVAVIIVDGVGATTVTHGSGWTEIADPSNIEAQQVQVRRGSTSTSVAWADTCDNSAGAYVNLAIVFEVKEASGGGGGSAIAAIMNSYKRRREQP